MSPERRLIIFVHCSFFTLWLVLCIYPFLLLTYYFYYYFNLILILHIYTYNEPPHSSRAPPPLCVQLKPLRLSQIYCSTHLGTCMWRYFVFSFTMIYTWQGFLNLTWVRWKRVLFTRSIAVVPSFVVAYFATMAQFSDMNDILNALMSIQLPFAVLPAIAFSSNPRIMGEFANGMWVLCLFYMVNI